MAAYNAGMSVTQDAEIDAWLRKGGLVVTASERAARALTLAFHRARQAEGLKAWNAPRIFHWSRFIQEEWMTRTRDGRLVLNRTQEQVVWAEIAARDQPLTTLLEGPRSRLAKLAMEAHELLCSHGSRWLRTAARAGWPYDAAAFSRWLTAFDDTCRTKRLVSAARLPLELAELLAEGEENATSRASILLVGFDRILPVQRALLEAWGSYREAASGDARTQVQFHEAVHDQAELAACALWCRGKLAAEPASRILVITQDVAMRRGEIERVFLQHAAVSLPFEFSLGVALSRVALPRAMYLLLRWLSGALAEQELDWLFSTGLVVTEVAETAGLQSHMLNLRRRGLQQPEWRLGTFIQLLRLAPHDPLGLTAWSERMQDAQRLLEGLARTPQTPLDWAEAVTQILERMRFGNAESLASAAYQAKQRCMQALETAASVGFDGRRMEWTEFLSLFERTLDETLFAPESQDAPILIAGPAESAGLRPDAIWFLGATEEDWPARGSTHPLLPLEVQRDARMPHATPQLDWELAKAISDRLVASAKEVHFSYARQMGGSEKRPSRVIADIAGEAEPLDKEPMASLAEPSAAEWVEDRGAVPYRKGDLRNGARVLTFQSQCSFKAFATARLGAEGWERGEAGLTAAQRGQLLHAVLHAVWADPPDGLRSHGELVALPNRDAFVARHVEQAFKTTLAATVRERMPARYLQAEQRRLVRLVSEWLAYESKRIPFTVAETEAERQIAVNGLSFKVRLDRLDRLVDESVLVIDYKSGDVTPKTWELPRPDDIQLPLYATSALSEEQQPGGLVIAKVRTGEVCFAGRLGDAKGTLLADLSPRSSLVSAPLGVEMLEEWRAQIEELAKNFLAGHADVDPREGAKTCERCGLQTLCRVQENQPLVEHELDNAEGADE